MILKKNQDKTDPFGQLREKAKALLGERPGIEGQFPADILTLVDELAIHQAELEIQNEELQRAQVELSDLNRKYVELYYDFAPCGYVTLDRSGLVQQINLTAASLLKCDRAEAGGRPFWTFIDAESREEYYGTKRRLKETGKKQRVEMKLAADNEGRSVWVLADIVPDLDESGEARQYRMTLSEITERKRTEDALARQSELLRQIFDHIPVLLVMWEPRLERFTLNRHSESVLGWTTEDANEGDFMSMVYPDAAYRAEVSSYMNSLETGWREWIVTAKNGEPVPADWANIRLSDDTMIGIGVDLRERKRAEKALRESEALYRAVAKNFPDGAIYVFDHDLRFRVADGMAMEKLGLTREGLEGKTIWEATDEQTRSILEKRYPQVLAGESLHYETVLKGRIFSSDYVPIRDENGDVIAGMVVSKDITERKQAEEALRKSERKFRSLFENSPDAVLLTIPDGTITAANPAASKILGWSEQEICRLGRSGILDEKDPRLTAALRKRREAVRVWAYELTAIRKGGERFPVEVDSAILPGEPEQSFVIMRDITERKRAEQTLAESESRFRTMADGLPLIVWVHDAEGRQKFVNHTFCEFFGVSEEEAGEEGWQALMHPEDGPAYTEEFFACVRDKRPFNAQVRVKRADGRWRYIESWGRPRFSSEGEFLGFVGTSADVHDRKLAEEALRKLNDTLEQRVAERTALAETRTAQLQKLALELSNAEDREREKIALVLHDDLQQYLAAIRFHLQMLLPEDAEGEKTREKIRKVEKIVDESIQKCRSLSHDLSPPVLRRSGFLAALEWLAEDMKAKHGFNVSLQFHKEAEPESSAVASVLFRSVRELLFNSVKHSGGETAAVEARNEGDSIIVRVEDKGKGCAPVELREKNESGKGFGLFSIKEKVAFLDGRFEIESAPGDGFRIILEVPKHGKTKRETLEEKAPEAVGGPQEASDESSTPTPRSRGGKTRIVLADDHAVVREGLASVLGNEKDFEVVGQAADGREAVRLALELRPDLVLMDVKMPEMDGITATAKIIKAFPQTRVIGLGMRGDNGTRDRMIKSGASDYICKAVPSVKLKETIRGILAQEK